LPPLAFETDVGFLRSLGIAAERASSET